MYLYYFIYTTYIIFRSHSCVTGQLPTPNQSNGKDTESCRLLQNTVNVIILCWLCKHIIHVFYAVYCLQYKNTHIFMYSITTSVHINGQLWYLQTVFYTVPHWWGTALMWQWGL